MVFTKFIVTGTIQVRTITNLVITLQTGGILFIVHQADQCAIKAQSYIQQTIEIYLHWMIVNSIILCSSLRMLINQHTLLFEPEAETALNQIGIIDTECNISKVIQTAFNSASFLCEEYYSMAPDINLQVNEHACHGKVPKLVWGC